ncbi:hypothetical protein FACS1894174_08660 [Bacteroidia bacterium]|nr:hypothetical protein FACS189455_4060 [Bacteroidia bacterium]GHV23145.1 hypothetical protein FACS1894174_08660 [Bacteroidia bacterium]
MAKLTKTQQEYLNAFIGKRKDYLNLIKEKYNYDFFNDISIIKLKELDEILIERRESIYEDDISDALCFIIGEVIIQELGGGDGLFVLSKKILHLDYCHFLI